MPEMDGFELCQAVKKNPLTKSVPVYLLSSALDDFDEDKAKKSGASGRFEKPFRSEDMVKQVMDVINAPVVETSPVPVQGLDDTFEEIDISLDSIMNSLDSPETDDEDMERAFKSAWDDDKDEKQEDVAQASPLPMAGGASLKILDLLEDASDEEEDADDEGLGVETLTGSESDVELAEYSPSDEAMTAFEDTVIMGSTPEDDSGKAEHAPLISTEDDDVGEIGDDLSEEAQAMLRAIEAEEPLIAPPRPRPSSELDGTRPVTQAMTEEVVKRAVESALARINVADVVERAVHDAVEDAFAGGAVRESVETAVKAVMSDMAPTLLASFKKVAEEVTLSVAETLVKQTIDQIKSGD
jgi:CheY-like chemotaxis protein